VARTRRRREIAASPERLWRTVADPHHLARWWPGVERVEDASELEWTLVFRSGRGKTIRADFTLVEAETPERLRWRQELEATPFERFLAESVTEIRLAPVGEGAKTRVDLSLSQRLRGWARVGAFLFRGASKRRLDEALANLDRAVAG
jgi:uncharacterized protein YndB with AHSA1/START domain